MVEVIGGVLSLCASGAARGVVVWLVVSHRQVVTVYDGCLYGWLGCCEGRTLKVQVVSSMRGEPGL